MTEDEFNGLDYDPFKLKDGFKNQLTSLESKFGEGLSKLYALQNYYRDQLEDNEEESVSYKRIRKEIDEIGGVIKEYQKLKGLSESMTDYFDKSGLFQDGQKPMLDYYKYLEMITSISEEQGISDKDAARIVRDDYNVPPNTFRSWEGNRERRKKKERDEEAHKPESCDIPDPDSMAPVSGDFEYVITGESLREIFKISREMLGGLVKRRKIRRLSKHGKKTIYEGISAKKYAKSIGKRIPNEEFIKAYSAPFVQSELGINPKELGHLTRKKSVYCYGTVNKRKVYKTEEIDELRNRQQDEFEWEEIETDKVDELRTKNEIIELPHAANSLMIICQGQDFGYTSENFKDIIRSHGRGKHLDMYSHGGIEYVSLKGFEDFVRIECIEMKLRELKRKGHNSLTNNEAGDILGLKSSELKQLKNEGNLKKNESGHIKISSLIRYVKSLHSK